MELNKQERIASLGWFAHSGAMCKRCGSGLGPFSQAVEPKQEFWGCGDCGIGVFCEGENQPDCDRAADIFMSISR